MYLHVPFCKRRCTYCDFVSFTDFSQVKEYFEALWREIELWSRFLPTIRVETIYVGGGSPSDVPFELLERTFLRVQDLFVLTEDFEFTVEVNPSCEFVERLRFLNVNRVSIGLQAADEAVLERVKRRHSVGDFFKAFEAAKSFAKVNVDFIVGLP
ncbi:MAG: radical SAM protein, partial [Pseudothermotoga sp.]